MIPDSSKVTLIPTDKIIPYEFNNRIHDETQIDHIANSINEFGFNQPLVIDEKNILIVGHGRLLAAKKLNLEFVPVIIKTDLNETQKKAYRILDNKIQTESAWDFGNLTSELGILQEMGFAMESWGLENLMLPSHEDGSEESTGELKDSKEYLIVITCHNEDDQQEKFNKVKEMGWDAKLI